MDRHVLIMAESAEVREALASALRERGCRITLASDGAEALQVIRSVAVTDALVCSRYPDPRSRRLRARLRRERPECRVLLVTPFGAVRHSADLLRFGSGDLLLPVETFGSLLHEGAPEGPAQGGGPDARVSALLEVVEVLSSLVELRHRRDPAKLHRHLRLARAVAQEMAREDPALELEVSLGALLQHLGEAVSGADGDEDEASDAGGTAPDDVALSLLGHIRFPWKVLPVIRHRGERYDGRGRPDGLQGREIPLGARILAAVNAYVEAREKEGLGPEPALQAVVREVGHRLDPEVVEVLGRVVQVAAARPGGDSAAKVVVVASGSEEREALSLRLQREGYGVEPCASPTQALDVLASRVPDLVLLSLDEEDEEAFQLLDAMQADENLRHVPVILRARHEHPVQRIRALRMGVDAYVAGDDGGEDLFDYVENALVREYVRRGNGSGARSRGIHGELENLALPEIVQVLAMGMKTARVDLECGDGGARLWFRDGALIHAECGDLRGEDAFYQALRWKEGRFTIRHNVRCRSRTIQQDPMFLVMEGLRRLDEEQAEAV